MMIMGDNDNGNNRNYAYNSDNDYNAKEVAKSRDAAVLWKIIKMIKTNNNYCTKTVILAFTTKLRS